MIIGYARVSTDKQSLDLQLDKLKDYGCERIFTEKISTRKEDRVELEKLIEILRADDTVVVYSLDRLGRSVKQLISLIEDFNNKKVNFVSLKENIDTTSPMGKFIFHLFSALAEMERDLISERTKAGLESARARGRVGGRPRIGKEIISKAIKMYNTKEFTASAL